MHDLMNVPSLKLSSASNSLTRPDRIKCARPIEPLIIYVRTYDARLSHQLIYIWCL